MKGLYALVKKFWPVIFLFVIEITLFISNYKPGTFLVGWDNLYPELNFLANFKRSFFSVWQEYRGLGLLDGMAHAANLPHSLFIWLLHFLIPVNLLRYFFVFSMHLFGGIGMYLLLKKLLSKNTNNKEIIFFTGAVFYLLNFATIQMFFAPLEVFVVHFAFLPWLILTLYKYLENPKAKNLLYFSFFSLISLPQGFVPQVFLAYFFILAFVLFFYFLKNRRKAILHIILVLSVTFSVNAPWILPYIYSIPNNSHIILQAKINQLSSDDIYLKNHVRGNLGDVISLKGFMLDVIEYSKEGKYSYIMENWRVHTDSLIFKITGFLVFAISLLGLLFAMLRKNHSLLPFAFSFLTAFFFLGNNIIGLDFLNNLLREQIPILGEAFRFSFTKFSIIFAFSITILFAYGLGLLLKTTEKISNNRYFTRVLFTIILTAILYNASLAFKGNFLFDALRLSISVDYFQTMDFFKLSSKNSRVATFPQPSFWNWRFSKDGYRGSGFIWYGIEQPILDRAFDPWSNYNENYYWEISYALYSGNNELFESVLEKYQINWLLVDENIISPASAKSLYTDELENMLLNSPKTSLAATFGKIKIYKVNLKTPVNNYVFLLDNPTNVEPTYKWNNLDQAFLDNGNYVSENGKWQMENGKSVYYPFRSLFSGRSQDDLEFQVEDRGDTFVFKNTLPANYRDYNLSLPEEEFKELPEIDLSNLSEVNYAKPDIFIDGETIEVIVPKVNGFLATEINPATDPRVQKPINCNKFTEGTVGNSVTDDGLLRLSSQNAQNCSAAFWLPDLPQSLGYLISVQNQNISGKSLLFWLENLNIRKADMETYLPKSQITNSKSQSSYFIQPPMAPDALGYTLHFDNTSIGQEKSINDLGKISVYPIPYKFLTSLKFVSPNETGISSETKPVLSVKHPNPSEYEITQSTINPSARAQGEGNQQSTILVLSQSFHSGWQAYQLDKSTPSVLAPFFGTKIGNHVLVNNWQNGWMINQPIPENQKIVIFFLPQYLEFAGFILLLTPFLLFIPAVKKRP